MDGASQSVGNSEPCPAVPVVARASSRSTLLDVGSSRGEGGLISGRNRPSRLEVKDEEQKEASSIVDPQVEALVDRDDWELWDEISKLCMFRIDDENLHRHLEVSSKRCTMQWEVGYVCDH